MSNRSTTTVSRSKTPSKRPPRVAAKTPVRSARSTAVAKRTTKAEAHALAPEQAVQPPRPFDLLTDVMDQVRLESTVYFRTVCNGAYGIRIAKRERTPFYAIQEGEAEIRLDSGKIYHASAGDLLLLPNAAPHVIGSGADVPVLDLQDWIALHPMDRTGTVLALRGNGPITRVTGGFFDIDALRINPLFGALPEVIHLKASDAGVQRWLTPTIDFIHAELDAGMQGAQTVLRRMADVLFIQAVRAYAAQHTCPASWLRGLSDRRVGRALMLMHARYAEPWTLDSLAREVGTSRTHLAVQFRELVGETPINYLTRWRVTRAATRLKSEKVSIERVAEDLGYGSNAVFSKAFRRVTGVSPARYRREQAAAHV